MPIVIGMASVAANSFRKQYLIIEKNAGFLLLSVVFDDVQ